MARWDAPRPLHWPVRAGRGPASQSHSPAAVCRAGQRLLACCWPSWDRCTTPQAWWSSWITAPPTLTPTQHSRCRSTFDAMFKSLFKLFLLFFSLTFLFVLVSVYLIVASVERARNCLEEMRNFFLGISSRGYSSGWRWRCNFLRQFSLTVSCVQQKTKPFYCRNLLRLIFYFNLLKLIIKNSKQVSNISP